MSKQQRQNAPEASKAPGAVEKPSESTQVETPAGAAPEASKAPGDGAAAAAVPGEQVAGAEDGKGLSSSGSISELERTDESDEEREHELECPACIALNGERPCSVACYVAAGYTADGYEERFGTLSEVSAPAPAEDAGPPPFVPPEGKAHCKALQTCGVRGMPAFAGEEFWFEWHEAEYLEGLGHVEILNKS